MKTTTETVETVEDITYTKPQGCTEISSKSEQIETDQIVSSSSEERRKFIIRAVIDPVSKKEISFKDAINRGIVNQNSGMYIDSQTGSSIPIPEAMNRNLILVDFTTSTKTKEEKKSIGLITIKTRPESKPYKITNVMDTQHNKQITAAHASAAGILDEGSGTFLDTKSNKIITISDALIENLVTVEESRAEEEEIVKTYAVYAVVDPFKKAKITFNEAVKKGLLDQNTGNYVNKLTGETLYVGDAIKRGFLKAKIVDDPSKMNIHADNKMVIERIDHIKKKFLKPMGIISAMKRISKVDISQK